MCKWNVYFFMIKDEWSTYFHILNINRNKDYNNFTVVWDFWICTLYVVHDFE